MVPIRTDSIDAMHRLFGSRAQFIAKVRDSYHDSRCVIGTFQLAQHRSHVCDDGAFAPADSDVPQPESHRADDAAGYYADDCVADDCNIDDWKSTGRRPECGRDSLFVFVTCDYGGAYQRCFVDADLRDLGDGFIGLQHSLFKDA